MRVPDLDWPTDLFTDVIDVLPETVVAAPRPALWAELMRVWTSNEPAWPVESFNSPQLAW